MSFCRIAANMSPSWSCTRSGTRGVKGGHSKVGPVVEHQFLQTPTSMPRSATTSSISSPATCSCSMISAFRSSGAPALI
jgi:hypothetical protein